MDSLEYIGGFFDGDGCIRVNSQGTSLCMEINQAEKGWEVFDILLEELGGKLYMATSKPHHQKKKLWRIQGVHATSIALQLEVVSHLKRDQLALGSQFTKENSRQICQQLKTLKATPHPAIHVVPTLPYFAGFFDADGCVVLTKKGLVAAQVGQKHRAICDALQKAFAGTVAGCRTRAQFTWAAFGKNGMAFFEAVLPFLVLKKRQVEIVRSYKLSDLSKEDAQLQLCQLKGKRVDPRSSKAVKVLRVDPENVVSCAFVVLHAVCKYLKVCQGYVRRIETG